MQISAEMQENTENLCDKANESAYDILHIPPKHIGDIWRHVVPFLIMGMQANPRMTIREIADGLVDQSVQLWVVAPKDEERGLVGCFLTSVERDAGEWVVSLYGLGGREARKWVMACHAAMQGFGRSQGASRVRLAGRPAWKRLLPDYAVTVEMENGHLVYERVVR